jgi:hypothetical protein
MGLSRSRHNPGQRAERGANLVEFAIVAPLLILLVLGIVEFGMLFAHYNELRHGAREGARYAAVSRPDYNGGSVDNSDVLDVTCDSIDLPGTVEVTLALTTDDDSDGSPDRLEYGTITVEADTSSLTGAPIISSFIPSSLTNDAIFRLEQDGEWTDFGPTTCP